MILLHIVPPEIPAAAYGVEIPPGGPVAEYTADKDGCFAVVLHAARHGRESGANQGPISETALAEIDHLHAGFVILGAHHHSALYQFIVGSTSADVMKHATFPLLFVPCDIP